MFERFTREARQALFWARVNVSKRRGDVIDIADLREGLEAAARFADDDEAAEKELTALEESAGFGDTSREVPLASATKAALQHASADADSRADLSIAPDHLLRGILRVDPPGADR